MDALMPPSIRHTPAPRLKYARVIVFFASFCLMTIEIVAGRVTAPYLGVSLYTWTSVIGAVLLGVTVGNYFGGWIADRHLARKLLGTMLALAGVATLAAIMIATKIGPELSRSNWPIWLSASVFASAVFFPAAFFLSTISPQVIKFDLHDLENTGITIGTIGAWSAIGSILGTFLTGFVFIAYVGTRHLMIAVAVALLIVGALVAWQDKIWRSRLSAVIALLLLGDLLMPSYCKVETNYYCLRVRTNVTSDGIASYHLYLDHLLHSSATPQKPEAIGYEYEQIHAALAAYSFKPEDVFSTLTIGGGGYVLPRYLEAHYPRAEINVVEIDPGVTEFNRRFMELSDNTRIQTFNMDARMFLARLPSDRKFDLIYGDAVNDFAVPYQITTQEFQTLVKSHLAKGGYYAVTIIDDPAHSQFAASLTRTLRTTFSNLYFFSLGSDMLNGSGRNTMEIVASDTPLEVERWARAAPISMTAKADFSQESRNKLTTFITVEQLEAFLERHPTPILTDDFAPVDNQLAPIFADAYQPRRIKGYER